MSETPPIPESISHKKLNKLLLHAKKEIQDKLTTHDHLIKEEEAHKIDLILSKWESLSIEVLESLKNSENYLKENKRPNSILALGAMEAHIHLAMQALKASKNDH